MKRFGARGLLKVLLVGSLVAVQTGIGVAQIPDPINTGGTQEALNQAVNDPIPTIEDNNVTNTVNNTVDQTTNTATDTTNNVTNTVDQTTNTVTDTTNNVTNTVNNTVDQTTNTVTETTNNVTNTVNNTVTQTTNNVTNTVNNTVNDTNNTVNETVNTVEQVVQSPKPKPAPKPAVTSPIDTVGTLIGTTTGTVTGTVNTGTQDAISALGGATGQYGTPTASGTELVIPASGPVDAISAIAAASGGSGIAGLLGSSGAASTGIGPTGRPGTYYSSGGGITPGLLAKRVLGARFLLNWSAILGASQPSLAILVDAGNDADGDGIYSDAEIASRPGADVSFKALITNIGAVNFEIATVSNSYNGGTGAAQGTVCAELVGIMLAPGESLACTFPVPDYAPAKGESLVNSITAAGFEVGKGARRGASDSDTSTVDTLLASDEVLAVAIKRNLAFTGTDAARLLAVGLLLLAAGGISLSLARLRSRRPTIHIPSESPVEALGWWAAGPSRTGSRWKVGRR